MIKERVIDSLSFWLRIDKNKLNSIFDTIQSNGFLQAHDLRMLSEIGLPIMAVISGVLKIEISNVATLICSGRKITYDDFLIIVGVIAQDFKYREQLSKQRT